MTRRIMEISPDLDPLDLDGELFIRSPNAEPLEVSRRRLEDAIRKDGIFDCLGAAALWYTFRRHPELSQHLPCR